MRRDAARRSVRLEGTFDYVVVIVGQQQNFLDDDAGGVVPLVTAGGWQDVESRQADFGTHFEDTGR